jgi:peptidoglycan/LPS O-acetylase OafA/YrhL
MDSIKKGKRIIVSIIVAVLLIDFIIIAFVSTLYAMNGKYDYAAFKTVQGGFRFLLEMLILYFLYRGHKWAKWTLTILLLLGGLLSVFSLMSSFNVFSLVLGVIYISISSILIASESVNNFFKYQRDGKKVQFTDSEQINEQENIE